LSLLLTLAWSLVMLAIKHFGGTVPEVEPPSALNTPAGRAKRRRAAAHACYEELQRLAGPPADKLAYVKVLNNGTRSLPCSCEVRWADYFLCSKS
jgi:hypothetical protein